MDVRSKDSIRTIEQSVEAIKLEVRALKEDVAVLTGLIRDIKKATVRKYSKDNG